MDYNEKIQKEWADVEAFAKMVGRPQRMFKADKGTTALIVVDMQIGFLTPGSPLELAAGRDIVPNIKALAKACRSVGIPVIWVAWKPKVMSDWGLVTTLYPPMPDGRSVLDVFMPDANGSEIWPELNVDSEKDYHVGKCRFSAFVSGGSNIERLLRSMNRNNLIMTGLATSVCLGTSAMDAMMLDFKVTMVSDATATFTDLAQQAYLIEFRRNFMDIVTTHELLKEIEQLA